jgi:Rhs element Vgr protein
MPDPSGDPVVTFTYGSNLLEFEAQLEARYQYAAVNAYAWNAADQEMLQLEGAESGATTPGNISSDDLSNVISLDEYQLKHSGQLTDDELQAWADGYALKSGYNMSCGRVRVQGFSGIKPGDLFALAGVGERFSGNAMATGLRHEINTKNWETNIMFGLSPEFFGVVRRDMNAAPANGLLPAISGLQIGLVTALEGDPGGEDRIQVRIPAIDPEEQGTWARITRLDAGENRGSIFLPEIGDEVILGFLDDDPRNPIVLGMLNSSAKPSPIPASDDNHEKGFVTRSEMKLTFNDDLISMTLETPNGNKVLLSDNEGGLTLQDENENKITLSSDGVVIESAADLKLVASGDIKLEGANIESAASSEFKAEGASGAEFSSGGSTVVKGSMVQIN